MIDRVVLAVDGGATKTTLRLARGNDILFEQTTTGSNYQAIGKMRVISVLVDLLSEVTNYTQIVDAACFAIAGIDTEADIRNVQEMIENSLQQCMLHCDKLAIENDVEATLLGLAQGRNATLVIAGTGAIAFNVEDTVITRKGGWGHRAGDEGSGYWIGKEILHAIFRAADGRGKETILSELVLAQIGLANTEELMNWLYASDYRNAHTASLASILYMAVKQQDFVALSIAQSAADELALLAITALSEKSTVLFLNGGIFQYNPLILERVRHAVASAFPNVAITLCSEKPIDSIMKRAQLL